MANDDKVGTPETGPAEAHSGISGQTRPTVTRRDFLIKGNAGAVAIGVMTGAGLASGLAQLGAQTPAQPGAAPVAKRRVTLDIDGRKHEVNVDVRESLWETLNHQLGLSNVNLGCDRAQCGACTVLVDSRAVNGCSLLTARLGRGQKIQTVAGIAPGPGLDGLHPVQRAFWFEGGFQCGICTRGFVMTSYALLQTNRNPSDAQIKEALAGNICRCGEYPKILSAVTKAAAELRGEKVVYAAPFVIAAAAARASAAPRAAAVSRQFEFVSPLGTIEVFDELAAELRRQPGIVSVSGTERTTTIAWDPGRLDEAGVRRILAEAGHAVKP
ncbi:MAG: (2Fe-2S)-binding protein [Acidobacteria bacterium]|nr:(2Fe-2S)-binding protein [Acidobacteriota bacterium]